jgi:hypothetical protein
MSYKKILFAGLLMLGLAIILAACGGADATPCPACATAAPVPTAVPCPEVPEQEPCAEPVVKDVPFEEAWAASGHSDETAEAFRHWDEEDPQEVPTSCAKCHTPTGYIDYLGGDGSEAGVVDANQPVSMEGITCTACHNEAAVSHTSVVFPSGVEITGLGGEARCMECHQGRASKTQIDEALTKFNVTEDLDTVPAAITEGDKESKLGFVNIHYFAAAATLYGGRVHGGYEYDGKLYDSKNDHVEGFNTCIGCHDQHSLEVKVDQCANCHEGVTSVEDLRNVRMIASSKDYDGDGDTEEGIASEIAGLQEALYAGIQAYASEVGGTAIVYDAAAYPYFLADADGDGAGDKNENGGNVGYPAWTGRLLKAAYNYQLSVKDPGAFAHGNKYIIQLLFDSIEDLNTAISAPIDMGAMNRDDAGHFAGNTLPFRDWDSEEFTVPYRCAKCHSAGGLPAFLHNGGTVVVDAKGNTIITGVGSMPSSNGFQCSTCHNEEAWPERYSIASVTLPSGKVVSMGGKDADGKFVADDANVCVSCHQGRESTTSVNNYLAGKEDDVVDSKISFKNIHYLAAGATLFGGEAMGAYQYADQTYVGLNNHPINKCTDCHEVHALEVKVEACSACHSGVEDVRAIRMDSTDYDGDGDVTEGISGEIDTLAEALYAQIQAYAATTAGTPILYDAHSYPYFFVDADQDGAPDKNENGGNVSYNAFTPRLLRAAYNYQYSQKDPGAFAHNPKYVIEFLIDSIADLGGDVTAYTRPEAPAE